MDDRNIMGKLMLIFIMLALSVFVNAQEVVSRDKVVLGADKLVSYIDELGNFQDLDKSEKVYYPIAIEALSNAYKATGKKFYSDESLRVVSSMSDELLISPFGILAIMNLNEEENQELKEGAIALLSKVDSSNLTYLERLALARAYSIADKKEYSKDAYENAVNLRETLNLLVNAEFNSEIQLKTAFALYFLADTGLDDTLINSLLQKLLELQNEDGLWKKAFKLTGDLEGERVVNYPLLTSLSTIGLLRFDYGSYALNISNAAVALAKIQEVNGSWKTVFNSESILLDSSALLVISNELIDFKVERPFVEFETSNLTGTTPFKIDFTFLEENENYTYFVNLGDGNFFSSNESEFSITVNSIFLDEIWIFIKNENGSKMGFFLEINVQNTKPIAELLVNPSEGKAPLQVQFDASRSKDRESRIKDYNIEFGDGNTINAIKTVYTYFEPGIYQTILTVEDDTGNRSDTVVEIKVLKDKTVNPLEELRKVFPIFVGVGVLLVILGILWPFVRRKMKMTPLLFLVIFLAMNVNAQSCETVCQSNDVFDICCEGDSCDSVLIQDCGVSDSPVQEFYCDSNTVMVKNTTLVRGCSGAECTEETIITEEISEGCEVSYLCSDWAEVCSEDNVVSQRTCTSNGCFEGACQGKDSVEENIIQVCDTSSSCSDAVTECRGLEIWETQTCETNGCFDVLCSSNEDFQENLIQTCNEGCFEGGCVANETPQAEFTPSTTQANAPIVVSFDASESIDNDGTISSWFWGFGDGQTGEGETTSHAYLTDGSYTVELTVTDNFGGTSVFSTDIKIDPIVLADEVNIGQVLVDYYNDDSRFMEVEVTCYPLDSADAIRLKFFNNEGTPLEGYESDFAACNSPWVIGPFPNGVYIMSVEYPVEEKCNACKRRSFFAVLDPIGGIAIPDSNPVYIFILLFSVLYVVNSTGKRFNLNP